jgi:hypothetical protein
VTDLLQRVRERKLLQRTLAYAAAAFPLLRGILYLTGPHSASEHNRPPNTGLSAETG